MCMDYRYTYIFLKVGYNSEMKITLIHGQNHKGSTYHIARMTTEKTGREIKEFFIPGDFNESCLGCYSCLDKGRDHCPHSVQVGVIIEAILNSDLIVIGSPTYVMEMTGQLKSFFDHLFTMWLPHRPEKAMFTKTAIVVSTAAGTGMNGVTKSMARQLFYLGIPKVYRISERVAAASWNEVKRKNLIEAKVHKIAGKIIARNGKASPGIKLKLMFCIMRLMHKKSSWSSLDKDHWEKMGWLGKGRPWK